MTSIKFKLLPIIVIGVIALSAIFYGFAVQTQEANLNKVTLDGIQSAKHTFYNLEENDIKMLKAAMVDFMTNQDYKDVFMENDREKLYNYGQDLFATHKSMGLTHFYFHRTDGTVFARIHNANKYDDPVGRVTYDKSVASNSWGTGIELGATAFALRVVHPYYNGDTLIGYIEYGEEIDHFAEIMKEQTGHDYGVIVKKEFINPDKWASVREVKGLRNNYDDLPNYVIIETTKDDTSQFEEHCFAQDDLDTVPDDGSIFNKFGVGDQTFICGGFTLYDAGDSRVGAVVAIQDVTTIEETAKKNNQLVLLIAIIGVVFIGGAMVFLVTKSILQPLDKVVDATTRVAGGDLSAEITFKSDDEIGQLAEMIEGFRKIVVNTAKELEESYKKQK